jgi:starch-binding outer membrane protein, SusD/RagB family
VYANSFLMQNSTLADYNSTSFNLTATTAAATGLRLNVEDVFHCTYTLYSVLYPNGIIDSTLSGSYNSNDLRRSLYFNYTGTVAKYKGSYDGSAALYGGLTTSEMYLVRAECFARKNDANSAMNDLNTLLQKRWKTGTFTSLTATSASDALSKILVERRKELVFRGLRWSDLRRLNKEVSLAVTLTRLVNGQTYTLVPNDKKYVLPIPDQEIQLSGIAQNPR